MRPEKNSGWSKLRLSQKLGELPLHQRVTDPMVDEALALESGIDGAACADNTSAVERWRNAIKRHAKRAAYIHAYCLIWAVAEEERAVIICEPIRHAIAELEEQ